MQILHALLRTFDLYRKVVVRCKARIIHWSVPEASRMMQFIREAKAQLRDHTHIQLNIKCDFPDSTGIQG